MKPLILITSTIVVLFSVIWVSYGAYEFDVYAQFIAMRGAFSDSVSCVGNSFISMGRILNYGWLRSGRHIFNYQYALNYRDAEYFFRKEQKFRDKKVQALKQGLKQSMTYYKKTFTKGEMAERYEYYCENQDPITLRNYCAWALRNRKLKKRIEWEWRLNLIEEPKCEFKKVHIKRYKFKSRRTFLRCPIVVTERNSEHGFNIYISSVENAPKNRLLVYVFMLNPEGGPYVSRESSQSRSLDYSVSDFDEREQIIVDHIQRFEPSDEHNLSRIEEIENEGSRGSMREPGADSRRRVQEIEEEGGRDSVREQNGGSSRNVEEIEHEGHSRESMQEPGGNFRRRIEKIEEEGGRESMRERGGGSRRNVEAIEPEGHSRESMQEPGGDGRRRAVTRRLSIQDFKPNTPGYQRKRSERTHTRDEKLRLKREEEMELGVITLLINKRHNLDLKKKTKYYEFEYESA